MKKIRPLSTLLLALAVCTVSPTALEAQKPKKNAQSGTPTASSAVFVNGVAVTQDDFARELARYNLPMTVQVPDGEYWYDPVSGLWGIQGGAAMGQMPPEMSIGGPLRADASTGGTNIFINGREIHYTEALYLQQLFGYVIPGRYWLNPFGIGGLEGGPAAFNIVAAMQQASGGGGSSYTRRGPFGSMGSDGQCSYYMTPGGSSVMSGNC